MDGQVRIAITQNGNTCNYYVYKNTYINKLIYICSFGPPLRYWVMSFEEKHNLLKNIAHRLNCYHNKKSMAERHQLYSSYIQLSGLDKKTTSGTGLSNSNSVANFENNFIALSKVLVSDAVSRSRYDPLSSLGRIAVHSRRIFERSKVGAAILKGDI